MLSPRNIVVSKIRDRDQGKVSKAPRGQNVWKHSLLEACVREAKSEGLHRLCFCTLGTLVYSALVLDLLKQIQSLSFGNTQSRAGAVALEEAACRMRGHLPCEEL